MVQIPCLKLIIFTVNISEIENDYVSVDQLIQQLILVENFILKHHKISSCAPQIGHTGQKLKKANFVKSTVRSADFGP